MAHKTPITRETYLSLPLYTWLPQPVLSTAPAGTAIYFDANRPVALCFSGSKPKASLFMCYATPKVRAEEVQKWLDGVLIEEGEKAAFAAEKAAAVMPFKVGDILDGTWGYEQTNVSFYKVKSVCGRKLTLCKMESVRTPYKTGADSGTALPACETPTTITRLARFTRFGWRVKEDGTCDLRAWDGKPVSVSWYY